MNDESNAAKLPEGKICGECNHTDTVDTVDCTNQGVWLTTAAAGGLGVLEVDFTNKPGV